MSTLKVDNRKRARARDKRQRRRISLEEQHKNFIAAVRRQEMLVTSKMKMSGSEKKNANKNTQNFFVSTYDISSIKGVTRQFNVVVVQQQW